MSRLGWSSARLQRLQPTLWLLAVVWYGVGDLVTTAVGLQFEGIVEAGPVVAPIIAHYGVVGMVSLKLGALGVSYGCWRIIPAPHRVGIPLGLAVVGVAITGWNALMVSTVILL